MATPGWFDANRQRAFPFVARTVALPASGPLSVANLPNSAIVDAGFIAGPLSGYDGADSVVYLLRVRRSGDTIYFDFACTAPGAAGATLTFSRLVGGDRYEQEFAESGGAEFSASDSASDEDCEEPSLAGFLVTGDLTELADVLAPGEELANVDPDLYGRVEPALVQNLAGAYVVGVGVANGDRTRVEAPEYCDAVVWPSDTDVVFIDSVCLSGDIVLRAGFNAGVRQSDTANKITVQAVAGGGAGAPCAEVPLYDGEEPPAGSVLLTGGPACGELLRSVNGQGGPRLELRAGLGVTVTPDPAGHRIVIDADFRGVDGCYADTSDTVDETEDV